MKKAVQNDDTGAVVAHVHTSRVRFGLFVDGERTNGGRLVDVQKSHGVAVAKVRGQPPLDAEKFFRHGVGVGATGAIQGSGANVESGGKGVCGHRWQGSAS